MRATTAACFSRRCGLARVASQSYASGMPSAPVASAEHLAHLVRDLFPELAGALVDVDRYQGAVVIRALNDGTPTQQQAILAYFGEARIAEVARARADRLSNPAYRA